MSRIRKSLMLTLIASALGFVILIVFVKKESASTAVQVFENEIKNEQDVAPKSTQKDAPKSKPTGPKALTIGWGRLSKMDYSTGRIPASVKQLESKIIRIPGFIVPLTDDWDSFDEFLIVPDPQACIHVPPPPPNQIVYVKTKKKLPASLMDYPLWFQGKLKIVNTNSDFGRAGYQLTLQRMEIYKNERVAR
jgi:hypothetical protein